MQHAPRSGHDPDGLFRCRQGLKDVKRPIKYRITRRSSSNTKQRKDSES